MLWVIFDFKFAFCAFNSFRYSHKPDSPRRFPGADKHRTQAGKKISFGACINFMTCRISVSASANASISHNRETDMIIGA